MTPTYPGIDRIRQAVSHEMTLVAYSATDPSKFFVLKPTDLQLQTDMTWTPYIQLHATCVITDMDIMETLDVRTNGRVQVHMGYKYADSEESEEILYDLYINEATVNFPDGTVELECFSDDGRAQETLAFWNGKNLDRSSLIKYTKSLLAQGQLFQDLHIASEFEADFGASLVKDAAPEMGDNVWDIIDELQQSTNTWIRPEDGRNWLISPRPVRASSATHDLSVGETGTVITGKMVSNRDNFYNACILKYEWDQGGPGKAVTLSQTGSASIYWGPYNIKTIGQTVFYDNLDRRATKAQADEAAKSMLTRQLSKGITYEVSAVSAYWLRCGDTVTLSLYDGHLESLIVESINWTHEGLMGLSLIKPEVGDVY